MSGSPDSPGPASNILSWELYLTRLESWAEQLVRPGSAGPDPTGPDPVAPPVPAPEPPLAGPLPEDLKERAQTVLEALAQAGDRLQAARVDVGRQLSALRQMPPRDTGEARYLDTSG